jgi:hypothetical protein
MRTSTGCEAPHLLRKMRMIRARRAEQSHYIDAIKIKAGIPGADSGDQAGGG